MRSANFSTNSAAREGLSLEIQDPMATKSLSAVVATSTWNFSGTRELLLQVGHDAPQRSCPASRNVGLAICSQSEKVELTHLPLICPGVYQHRVRLAIHREYHWPSSSMNLVEGVFDAFFEFRYCQDVLGQAEFHGIPIIKIPNLILNLMINQDALVGTFCRQTQRMLGIQPSYSPIATKGTGNSSNIYRSLGSSAPRVLKAALQSRFRGPAATSAGWIPSRNTKLRGIPA
jgi:hypothetical protein